MGRKQKRRAARRAKQSGRAGATAVDLAPGFQSGSVAPSSELISSARPSTGGPRRRPVAAPKVTDGSGVEAASASGAAALDVDDGSPSRGPSALEVTRVGCEELHDTDPQSLGLSYTFRAPSSGAPGPVTVQFDGVHRSSTAGAPDTFTTHDVIDPVLPSAGPITLTRRVENIPSGEWDVTASIVAGPADLRRASSATASGRTGYAPVVSAKAPGTRLGSWPGLVGLGAVVALGLQSALVLRSGLPMVAVLSTSLLACFVGLVGAKVYYLVEHRDRPRTGPARWTGMCLQGFVLAAMATMIIGSVVGEVPVLAVLDLSAPALVIGAGIGRLGCWFGGCCAGRPTASRWGLWSSDRRLGMRRVPTQLIEASAAAGIGLAAATVAWSARPAPVGALFVATLAAYLLARQLVFPLRSLPRNTRYGRAIIVVASAVAVTVAGGLLVV